MKYSLRYSKTGMIHENRQHGIKENGSSDVEDHKMMLELVDCQDSTTA